MCKYIKENYLLVVSVHSNVVPEFLCNAVLLTLTFRGTIRSDPLLVEN